jgi:hypothetical protein
MCSGCVTVGEELGHEVVQVRGVLVVVTLLLAAPLFDACGASGPQPAGEEASCAVEYSPTTLARRAFAFDGVVVSTGKSVSDRGDDADFGLPGVTFEVLRWYAGGTGSTVTVDVQGVDGQDRAQTDGSPSPGTRLLVSGEPRWGGHSPLLDPIAWGCGFTRSYDPGTAALWQQAFSAGPG